MASAKYAETGSLIVLALFSFNQLQDGSSKIQCFKLHNENFLQYTF